MIYTNKTEDVITIIEMDDNKMLSISIRNLRKNKVSIIVYEDGEIFKMAMINIAETITFYSKNERYFDDTIIQLIDSKGVIITTFNSNEIKLNY